MQDVDALGRRLAVAHHQAPGIERHRLVGLVLDALLDVEHEELVERDVEGEDQALAVVPGEPRRLAGRHRGPVGGPQRVGAGHLDRRIGRRPAELGVVGMRAADRRQHRHGIALGIDRDAILGQPHIVDARALEVIEPISSGVSKVTRGERASASVRLTIWAGWVAGAPGCTVPWRAGRARLAGRRLRRAVLGRRRLLLVDRRLGRREGILPAHDDQHREHDSDNEILLVHLIRLLGALGGLTGKLRRHGIEARASPRPAAAEPMRRQPAAAQRAMARHRLGRIGRAGRLIAAGADEEVGQRQLIEADCAAERSGSSQRREIMRPGNWRFAGACARRPWQVMASRQPMLSAA